MYAYIYKYVYIYISVSMYMFVIYGCNYTHTFTISHIYIHIRIIYSFNCNVYVNIYMSVLSHKPQVGTGGIMCTVFIDIDQGALYSFPPTKAAPLQKVFKDDVCFFFIGGATCGFG